MTHSTIPRGTIPALSLAAFGSAISLRVTDPLLPRLATEFGVSLGNVAYIITAFSIAYGISQLFFGPIGDRFGKYLVIACACMACALTTLLCALAPSYPTLIAARLLAGATAAAIIPLSMAWIGDVVPYEERQPVLAQFLIGQIVGISAGVLLGGVTADHLSWRVPFFLISGCFVLIGLTLFSFNRRLPPHALTTRKADGAVIQRMFNEFRQVLLRPWARVILATVFLEGAFLFGAFTFIAAHLHQIHHISLTLSAGLVMLYGFGGLVYALTSRRLVKRLGEKGLARWGGILLCVSLLVVALSPVWWTAIPACLCCGLGFYMLHNTLQINATQMAPERRGAAVSIFASCFFLGQSAGVGLAGTGIGYVGTAAVIAFGAVGVLLTALNFSRLKDS